MYLPKISQNCSNKDQKETNVEQVWKDFDIYYLDFSSSTIQQPSRQLHVKRCSGVSIVNFEHISHLDLVFLLLTSSLQMPAGKLTIDWITATFDLCWYLCKCVLNMESLAKVYIKP